MSDSATTTSEPADKSTGLLSDFNALTRREQSAFLAWFAGGNSYVTKYENRDHVSFGKAECEWVSFDFWLTKIPALGWITIEEVRRGIAKGAIGQPEFVEYHITATDKGFDIREAYWNRLG